MKGRVITITVYLLMMFGVGFGTGYTVMEEKYEKLQAINNNLYTVIETKDKSYDELLQQTIEYRWLYEDCLTMFGDYQDKVEAERNKEVNK